VRANVIPTRRDDGSNRYRQTGQYPRETRLVPVDYIERRIYRVREQNVMRDSDLADLYQVTTGNLNLAVKRNLARFPADSWYVRSWPHCQERRAAQ
jgi:hypothetical protein